MFSRFVDKLTKTKHLVSVSIQDFGTGSKLMERKPRNIKDCGKLQPDDKPPISSEDIEPKASTDTSFLWVDHGAPVAHPFHIFKAEWWTYNKKLASERSQQYDFMKIKTMGNNIAAAYFVLEWNGKVKFKNSDWLVNTKETPVSLPSRYQPNYIVVAIDASNTLITYEGLKNMSGLLNLKWLSFKGSPHIDDWCVDKIAANYPSLEYLDISDCKDVTERGLEAIYKLFNLKTLIVTNHHKSAAFELTCLMLEDCNPGLECKIMNSRYSNEETCEKK